MYAKCADFSHQLKTYTSADDFFAHVAPELNDEFLPVSSDEGLPAPSNENILCDARRACLSTAVLQQGRMKHCGQVIVNMVGSMGTYLRLSADMDIHPHYCH